MPSSRSRSSSNSRAATVLNTPSHVRGRSLGSAPRPRVTGSVRSSSRGSRMSLDSSYRSSASTTGTAGLRTVAVKLPTRKSARKVQFKKKAPVKVSSKFKAKIEKALEPKMPAGYYWNVFTDTFNTPPVTNEQYTQLIGKVANATQGLYFSPLQILDAASILWNGKLIVANPTFADANMFSTTTSKVFCKDAWVDFKMRNNTQRTFYFTIYECAPKSDDILDPYVTWNRAITTEAANGVIKGGMANGSIYNSPTMFKEFNQAFKVAKRSFILQPGQLYTFKVQGPQNYIYDYAKYAEESVPKNIQKMCRYVMGIHYVDLVSGGLTGGGRATALNAQDIVDDIIVETTQHYRLGMPAQTGWKSTGSAPAAGPVPLSYVTDSKAYGPFQGALTGTSISRIDETNPTANESV